MKLSRNPRSSRTCDPQAIVNTIEPMDDAISAYAGVAIIGKEQARTMFDGK